jgi:hypothetical protein
VGYGTVEAWRERAGSLAAVGALDGTSFTLTGRPLIAFRTEQISQKTRFV